MVDFPTDLDELTNPTGEDNLDDLDHAAQHSNANDILEALEAKVGIDGSEVASSHDKKIADLEAKPTIGEYMVPVWAEENSSLGANAYEWAYGNGANTPNDGGITIYVPSGWECHVVAMSLRIGSGTATVELVHNGTVKGDDCNVAVTSGQSAVNVTDPPIEISNNDYINFRTTSASGTSSPNVVCAFLRYRET